MKTKTIRKKYTDARIFIERLAQAIADGWTVKRIYFDLSGKPFDFEVLTAELTKDEAEEAVPQVHDGSPAIKIKYFDLTLPPLKKIGVGDWIDLRSAERVELRAGQYHRFRLGVGMILPPGYEAHMVARSSTPEKFGIMCANGFSVIDNSYSGESDEWQFPALAIRDTIIEKGDRIAQFRLERNQPYFRIEYVERLHDISRGGIGSTGKR